jgi:hypothetical protein
MTAKLNAPLKRELTIGGKPYTLTTSPEGLNLVPKGRRKGYRLSWEALVSGDAALAAALTASVQNGPLDAAAPRGPRGGGSAGEGRARTARRRHGSGSH